MGREVNCVVRLEGAGREELESLLTTQRAQVARVLLNAYGGRDGPRWSDARIAEAFEITGQCRVRADGADAPGTVPVHRPAFLRARVTTWCPPASKGSPPCH
jgi:hypothetical protein